MLGPFRQLRAICAYWLRILFLLIPLKCRMTFGHRRVYCKKPHRNSTKPEWVTKEVIRLKALMPDVGCRKIANTFNRLFSENRKTTVSKTFVNGVIKRHNYAIQILRRKIKNRIPKAIPTNLVWGMDLTGKIDSEGKLHNMLGIIEHQSRACLSLAALKDKATITILRVILDAVELYGKPKFLRTDNEPIFTSRLFRFGLWIIGIRHQLIDKCCPWQNGRIERFWWTLKEKLNQWQANGITELTGALSQFRFWYNHVRPHQHLDGRTPVEVWNNKDIYTQGCKTEYWFEAWDGLLTGVYLE